MSATSSEPVPPPPPPAPHGDAWIWGGFGAVVVAVALIVVLWRRRGGAPSAAPAATPSDPHAARAEALPTAFGPPAPQIVGEPSPEEEGEPLRAIPPDSTEWMEGEVLETEGGPRRVLRPVDALIDALHSGDALACADAVEELVRHGASAVPALEQALNDEDQDVRVDVAKALAAIRQNEG